ncbi:TIGR01777 family oxidoreductase [Aureivirga sp. CE67]|uniref:TIGR01777 family oxidoreductase n=1 Tax=Aureivirga sp. CE67 TaxID=1788983 RepID=UPI0018CB7D4B|nr:TIGR01777 family oxidoreductase [Aureivirga sp. CE67]
MKKEKVIITGGTGFLGKSLANYLTEKEYDVVIIARSHPKIFKGKKIAIWDGFSLGEWAKELENAKAIINLAGKSVNCIKTPENCDEILRSRVDSTKIIGEALRTISNPPKIWIQMSTAHIYGDSRNRICDENATLGYGIAPFVGKKWEETFHENLPKNCRGFVMRTSFVVGKNGGALKKLKQITKLGFGGKTGSGNQGMSWIHETDFHRIVLEAIQNDKYSGIYNVSAPKPVSNKVFMKTLREVLKTPISIFSPTWMTKFGAKYFLKTDAELALYGRYIHPKKLEKEGFEFHFPELKNALENLIN